MPTAHPAGAGSLCPDQRCSPAVSAPAPGQHHVKELMARHTGCERSNSFKQVASQLGERPCRSATQFLVRLYLVSLLEHASAWLAEDRKQLGDGPSLLHLPQATAA